jgi:hypothetical protein
MDPCLQPCGKYEVTTLIDGDSTPSAGEVIEISCKIKGSEDYWRNYQEIKSSYSLTGIMFFPGGVTSSCLAQVEHNSGSMDALVLKAKTEGGSFVLGSSFGDKTTKLVIFRKL